MMLFLTQLWTAARLRPGLTACLVITVVAGAGNYPLWQRRREVTREHEEVSQRGEAIRVALNDRGRINADLAVLTEAQESIDRNLVSEQSMEVNLGYFYRLEKISRVRLARIDQLGSSPAAPDSSFKTVPISLQVSGTYRNLLGFMRELETGPRILRVRSFRLERTDPNGVDLALALSVELLARP